MLKALSSVADFGLKLVANAVLRKVIIRLLIGGGLVIAGVNIPAETIDQVIAAVVSI